MWNDNVKRYELWTCLIIVFVGSGLYARSHLGDARKEIQSIPPLVEKLEAAIQRLNQLTFRQEQSIHLNHAPDLNQMLRRAIDQRQDKNNATAIGDMRGDALLHVRGPDGD